MGLPPTIIESETFGKLIVASGGIYIAEFAREKELKKLGWKSPRVEARTREMLPKNTFIFPSISDVIALLSYDWVTFFTLI
jgi:hypothetical protein